MNRKRYKDKRGFKSLKNLFKNKNRVKDYWEKTGAHTLSSNEFSEIKRKLLYDHTWKITVDTFIKMGKLNRKKRVLDVGCGWGRTIVGLKKFIPEMQIIGVDVIPELLNLAVQVIVEETNRDDVKFVVGGAQNLGFSDNSFDVVISTRVLQYVSNVQKAVKEMARVLKRGGRLVILLPNKSNLLLRMTYHTKLYSSFDIAKWFRNANLKVMKIGSIGFIPTFYRFNYKSKIVYVDKLVRNLPILRYCGGLAMCVGEKEI